MLLASLIANLQADYTAIQEQIDALQEQQRLIQAHLQNVGSVESKLESGLQVMMDAIASARKICPGELVNYKEIVIGLFNGEAVGLLPDMPEMTNEQPTDPEPTPETDGDPVIDVTPEVVTPEVVEPQPEPEIEATDDVVLTGFVSVDELCELPIALVRKIAASKGVGGKGKRWELANRLEGKVTPEELKALMEAA